MGRSRTSRRNRRGVAAVEFAVVLPIIIAVLLGIWEVGRVADVKEILFNSASVGGRMASTGVNTAAQVQTAVTNYLALAGIPTQNVTVTVNDLTSPGTDPTAASTLDQLQVIVTVPFSAVSWSSTSMFVPGTTLLSATVRWYSTNPQSYPANITVPAGS
jgi:Flp pilus assembly protein TadG